MIADRCRLLLQVIRRRGLAQQTQCVGRDEHCRAGIGKDRHPEWRSPEKGRQQDGALQAQGDGDVLPDIGQGRPGQRQELGHADQSIGKNVANGNVGLIAPNLIIRKDFEEVTIDGVKMVFQNTPDTEAPVEMNTYFPQWKAFWAAENVTGTIHNIYTPRGAPVRNALNWSKHINVALYRFGRDAEVMFASHSWPRWGNARIQEVLRAQRDTYANLNNQSLHYANLGVTINEIQNVYQLPQSLWQQWPAHSYHGSEQHNSRAVINRFLGYWDGNPTTIAPLSPKDSAPLYVEMMGGADKIMAKGKDLVAGGQYLLATEILDKLVHAQPQNQAAKDLLADAFEQLGYQKESPTLRNIFLQGAYELRNGLPAGTPPRSSGPDMVRAMSTENWLDFIGISAVRMSWHSRSSAWRSGPSGRPFMWR